MREDRKRDEGPPPRSDQWGGRRGEDASKDVRQEVESEESHQVPRATVRAAARTGV